MNPKDQAIADAVLSHAVDLSRLEAGLRKRVINLLTGMKKELRIKLAAWDITDQGKQTVNKLISEATEVINDYYAKAGTVVEAEQIAEVSARATKQAMELALIDVAVSMPTARTITALAANALIEGAPAKAWWAKQSQDMAFRFAGAVRQGLAQAETNTQIIRRVTDAIGISQRNAAALVQTSVAAIANDARMAAYKANDDLIAAYRWLATFDARVCPACSAREGLEWKPDGSPIGHSVPYSVPPIHFNDRCILVPRTKTFRELGLDIDEIDPSPRATAGGPTTDSFDEFLERKGADYQNEIFGKGRADLYRRGVITRAQLLDNFGNELTLKELLQKYGGKND